jgi:flavin reductase
VIATKPTAACDVPLFAAHTAAVLILAYEGSDMDLENSSAQSETTMGQPIASAAYRDAMARLSAAVNIITTDGPAGLAGFTASAVCSVSDAPPTLLVCLNRSASVYEAFSANGIVAVNTLAASQQALSRSFGGKTPMQERFSAAKWWSGKSGAPILDGALVTFDCKVRSITEMSTHDVLFCDVIDIVVGSDSEALVYFRRSYHSLHATAA